MRKTQKTKTLDEDGVMVFFVNNRPDDEGFHEQVERVMGLVERYGAECFGEGSATNPTARQFYMRQSIATLSEIRAALTSDSEVDE